MNVRFSAEAINRTYLQQTKRGILSISDLILKNPKPPSGSAVASRSKAKLAAVAPTLRKLALHDASARRVPDTRTGAIGFRRPRRAGMWIFQTAEQTFETVGWSVPPREQFLCTTQPFLLR